MSHSAVAQHLLLPDEAQLVDHLAEDHQTAPHLTHVRHVATDRRRGHSEGEQQHEEDVDGAHLQAQRTCRGGSRAEVHCCDANLVNAGEEDGERDRLEDVDLEQTPDEGREASQQLVDVPVHELHPRNHALLPACNHTTDPTVTSR